MLALLVAGCVHDSYECHTDGDCDIGTAGRCETDHRCTAIDDNCPTNRSYTTHSGDQSGQCYVGTVPLANACMGGQPPATEDGCAATVCALLPSCCLSGWSEACAAQAQASCPDEGCSTKIAITATKAGVTELWELDWQGTSWRGLRHTDRELWMGYAAPEPGSVEPRIIGFHTNPMGLVVGDNQTFPLPPGRAYHEVTSVDFDRDRRDVVALTWDDGGAPPTAAIQILHLDDSTTRDVPTTDLAIVGLTWGAYDDDAYPDAAGGRFNKGLANQSYYFLGNGPDDADQRTLTSSANSSFTAGSAPSLRSLEWADLDNDGQLDFVAFGNSARVHTAAGNVHVSDQAKASFDCSPIQIPQGGACTTGPAIDTVSVAGAVIAVASGKPALALSTDQVRELYRVKDPAGTPGISRVQTGVCSTGPTCAPILAIIARDLDHDGVVDLVAIDANLHVFTVLGTAAAMESMPMEPTAGGFVQLRTQAAGSPATP
ncbi:MAG TPA: hypothetical protein VGO00_02945 [Kofleriaceae bacterium]|jgi:hypothetical protein|nr:hypothetical protein [Kofleriaceae bacterium]